MFTYRPPPNFRHFQRDGYNTSQSNLPGGQRCREDVDRADAREEILQRRVHGHLGRQFHRQHRVSHRLERETTPFQPNSQRVRPVPNMGHCWPGSLPIHGRSLPRPPPLIPPRCPCISGMRRQPFWCMTSPGGRHFDTLPNGSMVGLLPPIDTPLLLADIHRWIADPIEIVILANKSDLHGARDVTAEEGLALAQKLGCVSPHHLARYSGGLEILRDECQE